jgi:uncharacterized membrane protein
MTANNTLERTVIVALDAPPRVRTAIILLWVSLLVTLIQTLLDDFLSNTSAIGAVAVVLAIYGLVVFRASRRHNWARYVLLIWTILAATLYLTNVGADAQPWWDYLLVVASFIAEIVAVYLLFTGGVGQWYRPRAALE